MLRKLHKISLNLVLEKILWEIKKILNIYRVFLPVLNSKRAEKLSNSPLYFYQSETRRDVSFRQNLGALFAEGLTLRSTFATQSVRKIRTILQNRHVDDLRHLFTRFPTNFFRQLLLPSKSSCASDIHFLCQVA